MEREQFVAVDAPTWWLVERDLDYRMEDLRRELGASFGWTDPRWYTERAKLDQLYDFLVGQGNQLFSELDQAIDDHGRQRWLGRVMDSKSPPKPASTTMESSAPTGNGAAPTNGASPKKSAFRSKSEAGPASGEPGAATTAPTNAAPGRKSIFRPKSQPAPPAAGDADLGGPAADQPAPAEDRLGEVDQQIQTVMSELSADELATIAGDLGLTPEEVEAMIQEPDFAALVAEEQVHAGSLA
jgi:hypothetical protein